MNLRSKDIFPYLAKKRIISKEEGNVTCPRAKITALQLRVRRLRTLSVLPDQPTAEPTNTTVLHVFLGWVSTFLTDYFPRVVTQLRVKCGFNGNVLHRLRYLNSWAPADGMLWGGSGGTSWPGVVCYWAYFES